MKFTMNPWEIAIVEASLQTVLNYMKDSAEIIRAKLLEKAKGHPFLKDCNIKSYMGHNVHFGNLNHHVAVDVKCQKKTKYFISMVTLNFDQSTRNVHEVWGRIQIILGINGNPNCRIQVKMEAIDTVNAFVTAYPLMNEDKTENIHKLIYSSSDKYCTDWITLEDDLVKGRRIFQTGYKLFGSEKCDDIVLTDDNIDEFVTVIIKFISRCEEVQEQ